MAVLTNINYFKDFPFYNEHIKKPKIKRLKSIDLLAELPFCKQLSIVKANQAFKGYAISYKAETVERKDLILQLEASKSRIKDLFSNLINEIKGLKYQITVKVLLKKKKLNEGIEFAPVYFNSLTKIVKNRRSFLWCHVRDINPSKEHPGVIKKIDKKLLQCLIIVELSFLYKKKI